MAVLPIRLVPDPILRQKAKRVSSISRSIHKLIDDMLDTVHEAPGVGLAAPQIGVPLRVIVISLPDEEDQVWINPQIVRRSGERVVNEGCLSLPGYVGDVKRANTVTVKGIDRKGREIRVKADDLLAQALEHEIDHINGVLYIDKLENPDTLRKIQPPKRASRAKKEDTEKGTAPASAAPI